MALYLSRGDGAPVRPALRLRIQVDQDSPVALGIPVHAGPETQGVFDQLRGIEPLEYSEMAKSLDPSRPVGLAVAGYPTVACQPAYRRG